MISSKKLLHIGGNILALLGVVFVIFRLTKEFTKNDLQTIDTTLFLTMVLLMFIYAAANLLLVVAWRKLLLSYQVAITFSSAVKLYGISQVAKYVPGNISHLLSRQALGISEGIAGWKLAKTSVLELVIIAFGGLCFTVLLAPLFSSLMTYTTSISLFVIVVILCFAFIWRAFKKNMAYTFALQTLFLITSGIIFTVLVYMVGRGEGTSLTLVQILQSTSGFVVAWLAGLITPGAPAGVGVREMVLLIVLEGVMNEKSMLLAVLLMRVVTVCGDLMFYVFSKIKSI